MKIKLSRENNIGEISRGFYVKRFFIKAPPLLMHFFLTEASGKISATLSEICPAELFEHISPGDKVSQTF